MQRIAVREEGDELLPRHARPGAHVAGVGVHERRAGTWVIADASALHLHGDGAQLGERHVGQEPVHRLAEPVLAVLGDAAASARAQHLVGGRRAVGGDDVDVVVRAGLLVDRPDEVEEMRVHVGRLVLAPVAQEIVHPLQLRLVVDAVPLEGEFAVLAGMAEEQLERLVRLARLRRPAGKRDDGCDEEADREPDAQADRKWRGRISQNAVALWIFGGRPIPGVIGRDRRVA